MLGAKENNQYKWKPDSFAQAVLDGEYDGRAFNTKVRQLGQRIDNCKITVEMVDYFEVCVTVKGVEESIASLKNLPRPAPTGGLEKYLDSLQTKKQELQKKIVAVLVFGKKEYNEKFAALKTSAATGEEKQSLENVQEQFEDMWAQVQNTMKSVEKKSYEMFKTKSNFIVGKEFVDKLYGVAEHQLSDLRKEPNFFPNVSASDDTDGDDF